jgi:hypothetical protein
MLFAVTANALQRGINPLLQCCSLHASLDAFDVSTGRRLSVDELVDCFTATLERALYP